MKKQPMHQLSERFDLPAEILTQDPMIEIQGHSRVAVDHHKCVLEYSHQEIWLQTRTGRVGILGSGLTITLLTRTRIEICGQIRSVELG